MTEAHPIDPYLDVILHADMAEGTKKVYASQLRSVLHILTPKGGQPPSLSWVVCNPKPVLAKINKAYDNKRTKEGMVVAIKSLFKHVVGLKEKHPECYAKWKKAVANFIADFKHQRLQAEPTERERKNWVPWPKVLEAERDLSESAYGSWDHLLLAMYCLIEPLRQNYGDVRLAKKDLGNDCNFIVVPKSPGQPARLVLNHYKTAAKYGRFERELPTELWEVIEASLQEHPRDYLFVDSAGNPYAKQNSFTQYSNRTLAGIFGKKFTVSMMRHSYISNIDFNEEIPATLFEKAKNMTHSVAMQQMYRRKVEPMSEDEEDVRIVVVKE